MIAPLLAMLVAACGAPMPTYSDPSIRHVAPGEYRVELIIEVMPTPEDVATRCNFGIPGGDNLGCTFGNARPRRMVVPMIHDANDWAAISVWGHEAIHGVFGDWHASEHAR